MKNYFFFFLFFSFLVVLSARYANTDLINVYKCMLCNAISVNYDSELLIPAAQGAVKQLPVRCFTVQSSRVIVFFGE